MIVQTSITQLVSELDRRVPRLEERSALVAETLRCLFTTHRSTNDEFKIPDRHAEELNREVEDILDYQVIP